MSKTGVGTLLAEATAYLSKFGWSVIPVRGKVSLVQWGPFQRERPTMEKLEAMFNDRRATGIAVVSGTVSGNLAIRDFDKPDSYERWAADHPDLASILPTSKTQRGYHVFSRMDDYHQTKTFDDGELRGDGSYVLLPPSMHPSGGLYEWLVEPVREIPLVQPSVFGVNHCLTYEVLETLSGVPSEFDEQLAGLIEQAIAETQPTETGQRHRKVFELCRVLRGFLPEDYNRSKLKEIVTEWHRRASPNIQTKSFDQTWLDFVSGWSRVKHAKGKQALFKEAVAKAAREPLPEVALKYTDVTTRRLVAVCAELSSVWDGDPFPLPCKKAGEALGMSGQAAWQHIQSMLFHKTLIAVGNHDRLKKLAKTYLYTGRFKD